jgi:hypothetical protein
MEAERGCWNEEAKGVVVDLVDAVENWENQNQLVWKNENQVPSNSGFLKSGMDGETSVADENDWMAAEISVAVEKSWMAAVVCSLEGNFEDLLCW